jgi:hypothetical protein
MAALKWLPLFLVPFFALVILHWSWGPSASASDYAQYLLHARAIIEGRPYAETGYIYHPAAGLIGPPAFPPGLPITLAPLVAIGGVHTPLVRLLMVGSVLLFAVLAAWRLAPEVERPWQAGFGAAIAAYAIEASMGTIAPLSDPGFAALFWATIIVVDRGGAWTWPRVLAVTALGFAAIAYRTAGVALIPGLLLYAFIHRARLGGRPFVPAAVWSAAGVAALVIGARVPFSERLARSITNSGTHLSTFFEQYKLGLFRAELYPFSSNAANDVYHAFASVLLLFGLGFLWRARRTFMGTLAAAYGLMLFIAPVAEPRYAWPLFPILGVALARGTTLVVQRVGRTWQPRAQTLTATVPLFAVLLIAFATDVRRPAPPSLVRHPDAQALFAWLSERQRLAGAAESLRVAFYNPRVMALEAGIASMGYLPRTAPGVVTALKQKHMTHIVWQGRGLGDSSNPGRPPCVQRAANRLPELYPNLFTIEYENATFRVYRFDPGTWADSEGERISWTEC